MDLNGDGDASDFSVLHVFDAVSGTATNLGLVTLAHRFDGSSVVFRVEEARQRAART